MITAGATCYSEATAGDTVEEALWCFSSFLFVRSDGFKDKSPIDSQTLMRVLYSVGHVSSSMDGR